MKDIRKKIKTEKFFECLFYLWIALPIFMCIYQIVMGVMGRFDDVLNVDFEELYVYTKTVTVYKTAFHILGIVSGILAIFVVIRNLTVLRDKASLKKAPWIYLFLLLLVWAAMSTVLSDKPIEQFLGYEYIHNGYISYLVFAAVFVCASTMADENVRKRIIVAFTGMVSILCVIMLLQETHNEFVIKCFPTLKASVIHNSNYFGYILTLSSLALLALYLFDENKSVPRRIYYIVVFVFQFITLLYNDTLGCIIAVSFATVTAYILYFVSKRKYRKGLFIPIIILVLLVGINMSGVIPNFDSLATDASVLTADVTDIIDESVEGDVISASSAGSGRWGLWKDAIRYIAEKPIWGYGPEGFIPPHNDILEVAGYLGIPGLLIYIAAFATLAIAVFKRLKLLRTSTVIGLIMIIGYFISAQFGHPVFNTSPYFYMILGMVTIACPEDNSFFSIKKKDYTSAEQKELESRKNMRVLIAALIFVFMFIAAMGYRMNDDNEKIYENSDLQGMRCAELSARLELEAGNIEVKTEFWYDPDAFTLIKLEDGKPQTKGQGTTKKGGALAPFEEEYNLHYEYDESADYTDKVLKVIVDPITQNIEVLWVK